ncbi:MAG: hypothetical protein LBR07_02770 [Puniceicoccales bacterium]|jgi:hypothetical protein|nr:hypothetical protein [Puniceicoccales bacterium]
MAFKIYSCSCGGSPAPAAALAEKVFTLCSPVPLRLSGPAGLIARFTQTLPVNDLTAPWVLEENDLLALAGLPPNTEGAPARMPVFEQFAEEAADTATGALIFSRLLRIHGKTGRHTELLCTFAPLETLRVEDAAGSGGSASKQFVVRQPAGGRQWSEGLKLHGGPLKPDSTWAWTNFDLNLGAAVFGSRGGA